MIVIHHNPDCGTSRNVLAIIEASGEVPVVIEYLKQGWTRPQLLGLFAAAGLTPRMALRETNHRRRSWACWSRGQRRDHPGGDAAAPCAGEPADRVQPEGVRLCRPSEAVLDLLETLPPGPLYKEDGEMLIDESGRRVG